MSINFPTLSKEANMSSFAEEPMYDPTSRTVFAGGFVQTKSTFTRVPYKWMVVYNYLTNTDRDILISFEQEMISENETFLWTNPNTSTSTEVMLLERITYIQDRVEGYWKIKMDMIEVV